MPEVVYRLFLFDFTAVLAENQAMIVRSIGLPLYFAAMAFFLLGGNAENGKQLNIIRYSGGLGLITFAVFTEFNGFFCFWPSRNRISSCYRITNQKRRRFWQLFNRRIIKGIIL
jgi:hypothetical protein